MLGALAGLGTLVAVACWLGRSPTAPAPGASCTPGRVDPERLKAHVRTLSETFHPRDHEHPENLERAADYVAQALSEAGGRVRSEPYTANGRSYRNVIATFGPESAERLVIGAHYDAAEGAPGADDNASGVAGLLELAALLEERPPPMQVELVGYTLWRSRPTSLGKPGTPSTTRAWPRSSKASSAPSRPWLTLEEASTCAWRRRAPRWSAAPSGRACPGGPRGAAAPGSRLNPLTPSRASGEGR